MHRMTEAKGIDSDRHSSGRPAISGSALIDQCAKDGSHTSQREFEMFSQIYSLIIFILVLVICDEIPDELRVWLSFDSRPKSLE